MDKKEVKKILADADGKYIEVTFTNGSWSSGKYHLKNNVFTYPARIGMDRMILDNYEIIKDIKVDEPYEPQSRYLSKGQKDYLANLLEQHKVHIEPDKLETGLDNLTLDEMDHIVWCLQHFDKIFLKK